MKKENPFPPVIHDEASGIEVPNQRYHDWEGGYRAGCKEETSLRYRVNVSQTSTGKNSFECTVEGTGFTEDEILARSDSLVAQLEQRYPPEIKEK